MPTGQEGDSWSNPVAGKEPSEQASKGGGFWRSLGGAAAEGAQQGAKRRAERVTSGEGNLFGGSSEKGGGFGRLIKWIFLIAFLWALAGIIIPIANVPIKSGFVETTLSPLKPVGEKIGDFGRWIGLSLGRLGRYASGEETFSLEGEVEEREKFGLELGDIQIFGLSFGNQLSRVEPLGIRSKIIVNKLDEERVEPIPANLAVSIPVRTIISGSIQDTADSNDPNACPQRVEEKGRVEGIPRSDFVSESGDLEIQNPYNPEILGFEEIQVDFTFDNNELTNCVLKKPINLVTIDTNLTYSLEDVETTLEVFAITQELYEEYKGNNRAFKELGLGIYKDYDSNRVLSKMKYRGDVEAVMGFDFQPVNIGSEIGSEKELAFQFKNNDVRNNARIRSFMISLPTGIEFRGCDYLDTMGSLNAEFLDGISNQINSGLGESSVFRCKVDISKDILGGAKGDVISGPHGIIRSALDYDYTTSKSKDVTINKPPESQPTQEGALA